MGPYRGPFKGSVRNKSCSYFVSLRQGGGGEIQNLSQKHEKWATFSQNEIDTFFKNVCFKILFYKKKHHKYLFVA